MTQLGAIYFAYIYACNLFDLYHTKDDRGEKQLYAFRNDLSLHLGMEVDAHDLALISGIRGRASLF